MLRKAYRRILIGAGSAANSPDEGACLSTCPSAFASLLVAATRREPTGGAACAVQHSSVSSYAATI